jgi:hypothetical protein
MALASPTLRGTAFPFPPTEKTFSSPSRTSSLLSSSSSTTLLPPPDPSPPHPTRPAGYLPPSSPLSRRDLRSSPHTLAPSPQLSSVPSHSPFSPSSHKSRRTIVRAARVNSRPSPSSVRSEVVPRGYSPRRKRSTTRSWLPALHSHSRSTSSSAHRCMRTGVKVSLLVTRSTPRRDMSLRHLE